MIEYRYLTRSGVEADWVAANPVLLQGEVAWSSDTNGVRYGDGVSAWSELEQHSPDSMTEPRGLSAETKAEISASNQPLRSYEVIAIGDSIDAGGDTDQGARPYWSGSIWSWLALLSRGRFRLVRNEGIGGQSTVEMLARFDTAVVDRKPGIVVIGGGRNDLNGGVPTASTRANIVEMVRRSRAAGILPVLHTLAPVDIAGGGQFNTVDKNRAGTIAHNAWLAEWARANQVLVLDLWRLWSQANGGYKAGFSDDGVHPVNPKAVLFAATALAQSLPPVFAASSTLPLDDSDPTNLWAGSVSLPGVGVPDGWFSPQVDHVSISAAVVGRQVNIAAGSENRVLFGRGVTPGDISAGDVVGFSGRLVSTGNGMKATVQLINQDYSTVATPVGNFPIVVPDGIFYVEYTVEAGVTNLMPYIGAYDGAGTLSVSQLVLRNLTRMGLR